MTRRRPLPVELLDAPFSRSRAVESGLPVSRLRGSDLERFGRGLYRVASAPWTSWQDLEVVAGAPVLDPESLGAVLTATNGVLSHQSAASLYGVPLPPWLAEAEEIHITGPGPELRSRRPGIAGHRRPLAGADVVTVHGVPCTTPEKTWLDLTSLFWPGQEVHATDRPDDWYPADLGYREWRIALQYDGRRHGMPDQQESDARRDEWFRRHGWLVIVITVHDLHDDLRSVIGRIRERAARLAAENHPLNDFAGSSD